MRIDWIDETMTYDGEQLKSLFAFMEWGMVGDSCVAFRGPCRVTDHMVDGVDLREKNEIRGADMVHFIVELFDIQLVAGVAFQRLLASIVMEEVQKLSNNEKTAGLYREGDDIYLDDQKLTISVATKSPVSCLIHLGVNVTNEGTPVKTISLSDFDIDPELFADRVLDRYRFEVESSYDASCTVKWVK